MPFPEPPPDRQALELRPPLGAAFVFVILGFFAVGAVGLVISSIAGIDRQPVLVDPRSPLP